MKRGGKVWIRIFPDKSVTAKPAETRMGSGKGAPDHWVAVRPWSGALRGIRCARGRCEEALRLASHKLPIATQFVTKETPAQIGASLPGNWTQGSERTDLSRRGTRHGRWRGHER